MNYEKTILELLERIQTLEEKVATLMGQPTKKEKVEEKMTTNDIKEYINQLKREEKANGKDALILRSGDIHKDLRLKNAMPQVCNAMRQAMGAGDVVLHTTPSGNSSTIEIQYKL